MNCAHTENFSIAPAMVITRNDGKSYNILIDESKEHMMGEIAKSALLNQSMIIGQDVRGYENYFHFPNMFDIESQRNCTLGIYDLLTVDEESLQKYAEHQVAKDGTIHVNIPDAAGFIKAFLALKFNQQIKIDTIALTPGGTQWTTK